MPWSGAHQAPLSMGFPRQECWSGLPFPSPGNLPDPGVELTSPALTARFFTTVPPGNPSSILYYLLFDFKFKRIEWKKLMDCSIFSLSPFYYSNRNLDVKLLSIYQFRKKFLSVNYICHGKNRVGRYLLSFWNVNSFLFQVYFKHPIKDYLFPGGECRPASWGSPCALTPKHQHACFTTFLCCCVLNISGQQLLLNPECLSCLLLSQHMKAIQAMFTDNV